MTTHSTAKTILLTLLLASVASPTACIQGNAQTPKEQTSFCEAGAPDELLLVPTPIPQTVITAVMNSNEGKQAKADAVAKHTELNPVKLLKGTTVHLSNSPSRFFIVMGAEMPLSGVDNTWFWIVQESGQNDTVLLWAGANCLHIKSTRTHGFRDLVAKWSSAAASRTETYKFDGKSYRLHRTRWHNNTP
jgi:hypothetical protein